MSLPPTAPPLIADVKVEGFVAENTNESHDELSLSGRNEYETLQISMRSACRVYEALSQMAAGGCGAVRQRYWQGCACFDLRLTG